MNILSKSNIGKLAACVAAAVLVSSCSKSADSSSSYSAYREDAILLGNVDVSAIRDSAIAKSLSETIPLDEASSLGFSKDDVVKISFSMTLPNSKDGSNASGTALVLLSKEITLDQLTQMIDEQNATKENDNEKVSYEKSQAEGVDVLVVELPVNNGFLPEGATNQDSITAIVTTLPNGKQTYVAIASPEIFGDLVHKRNSSQLPSFAKEGLGKLSNKEHGFLVLKITPEMKEGLQEVSRNMKEDPAAMGMPFPPSLADNLPALKYIGLGTTLKDSAVLELQGVFDSEAQATGFATGLTNVIAGLQFAMAMALANSPEGMNVLPAFTQANNGNAASIVLTVTKTNQ